MKFKVKLVILITVYASFIYGQAIDCYTVELSSNKNDKNQIIKETYCKGKIASKEVKSLIAPNDASPQYVITEHDSYRYDSLARVSRILCKKIKNEKTESIDTIDFKYNFKTKFESISNIISIKQLSQALNYLALNKHKRYHLSYPWNDHSKTQWSFELSAEAHNTVVIGLEKTVNRRYSYPELFNCYKISDNSIRIQEIKTPRSIRSGYKRQPFSVEIIFNKRSEIESITNYGKDEILTYFYDKFGQRKHIKSNSDSYNNIKYKVIEEK